ncbi:hypothetical protein ACFL0R_03305 [Pseudomonadota bacterium]
MKTLRFDSQRFGAGADAADKAAPRRGEALGAESIPPSPPLHEEGLALLQALFAVAPSIQADWKDSIRIAKVSRCVAGDSRC